MPAAAEAAATARSQLRDARAPPWRVITWCGVTAARGRSGGSAAPRRLGAALAVRGSALELKTSCAAACRSRRSRERQARIFAHGAGERRFQPLPSDFVRNVLRGISACVAQASPQFFPCLKCHRCDACVSSRYMRPSGHRWTNSCALAIDQLSLHLQRQVGTPNASDAVGHPRVSHAWLQTLPRNTLRSSARACRAQSVAILCCKNRVYHSCPIAVCINQASEHVQV